MKHKPGVNEGGWIQKFDAAFSSRPVFSGIRCLLATPTLSRARGNGVYRSWMPARDASRSWML